MGDASKARVKIYGQFYDLTCEGREEYLRELADFVDSRMREITRSTGTVDTLTTAILAALNIADDYFQLKRTPEPSGRSVCKRTEDPELDSEREN